jgi:hypothetical protein
MEAALLLHLNRNKARAHREEVKNQLDRMMMEDTVIREQILTYRGVPYVKLVCQFA